MLVSLSQLTQNQLSAPMDNVKGLEPVYWAGYEPQTLGVHLAGGATTVDNVMKLEVQRKQIYIESNLISTGTKIAAVDTMRQLKQKYHWPGDVTVEYPVAFSYIGRRQGVEWSEYEMVLQKAVIHFEYQDEAAIVGDINANKTAVKRKTGESFRYAPQMVPRRACCMFRAARVR